MEYFRINGIDFSPFVSSLKVNSEVNYNAQTNAAGNTVVDYINTKRKIEVGIIPMDNKKMMDLLFQLESFVMNVSFKNPNTNAIETISAILPENNIEFYTIQENKVLFKAATLTFIEL